MKTIKLLGILSILLLAFSCGSDDDNDSTQQTNQQLLTLGKWYQETKTPTNFTACEKNGSVLFNTNGDITIESFGDGSGTCESLGAETATYTLTNNVDITIIFGSETLNAVINGISTNALSITNDDGEVLTFDKTQG
jgi:hypothetical protein